MPTIRCATRTTCPPGFPGSLAISADNPISNFSSLDPDQNRFIAIEYPEPPVGPITFYAYGCIGVCYGATQAEADACAAAQQASCYVTYYNTDQTCVKVCADGSQQAFTTFAGQFQAETQAQADQLAYNWACEWVNFYCNGGDTDTDTGGKGEPVDPGGNPDTGGTIGGGGDDGGGGDTSGPGGPGTGGGGGGGGVDPPITPPDPPINNIPNTQQECTVHCFNNGTTTAVVPAGWILTTSKELSDSAALAHACQLATDGPCLSGFAKLRLCVNELMVDQSISLIHTRDNTTYSWEFLGSIIPGLSTHVDGNTIWFTGTPNTVGTYTFTLRATGSDDSRIEANYTLKVAGFDSSQTGLAIAQTCRNYTEQFLVVGPLKSPLHFSVIGSLPPGLVLDESTGVISGIPTDIGPYTFEILLMDSP